MFGLAYPLEGLHYKLLAPMVGAGVRLTWWVTLQTIGTVLRETWTEMRVCLRYLGNGVWDTIHLVELYLVVNISDLMENLTGWSFRPASEEILEPGPRDQQRAVPTQPTRTPTIGLDGTFILAVIAWLMMPGVQVAAPAHQ